MEGPSGSGKGGNKKKKGKYMNPLSGEEGDDEYDTDEEKDDDEYDTGEEENDDEYVEEEDDDDDDDGGDDEPLEWSGDGQEYVEESEEESSEVGGTEDRDLDIKDVTVEDEEDRSCGSSPYPTDSPISPRPHLPPSSSEDTSS